MTVRVATSACRMVRLSVTSVGAVMDYLACWWTLKWGARGGSLEEALCLLPILKSCSTRNWHHKPFQVRHYENVHWWISFVLLFFCVSFLFCYESVGEYYGNRRQARQERWFLFDPQARNALLIQSGHKQLWWGSWNYSRIVFFFHIVMFIFLFKIKNTFLQSNKGSNAKNLRCIASFCLWVKRKYKTDQNLKRTPV